MVLGRHEWGLALLLIIADQFTKWIALATQPSNFLFELTMNTGAGFGILQEKNAWLLVFSIVVLVVLWGPLQRSKGRERLALLALSAGIVGNAIDRLLRHAVVDFISVGNFPVFNVADALISLSILYLVAKGLRESFSSWNFKRKGKARD